MADKIAGIASVTEVGKPLLRNDELALEIFLNSLLTGISGCPDLDSADRLLDQLGQFQTELARACFDWDIPLPKRLRMLVREFDRSDDRELRAYVFDKIKKGLFCNLNAALEDDVPTNGGSTP